MTHMFAELRGVSRQLIAVSILIGEGKAPVGTAQTALNGRFAARGCRSGLTHRL